MAVGRIKSTELAAIAAAIRAKNGASTVYKPGEMAAAITNIPTGYPEPTGTISITENGTQNVKDYLSADVNVPNSYAAADEGKVVSNGELVAQGSDTVTENGTIDTTLISSLVVNVSGGGGGAEFERITPVATDFGNDCFIGSGTWYVEGGGGTLIDIYEIDAGRYILMLGSSPGNRFRSAFYSSDPRSFSTTTTGTRLGMDMNDPPAYSICTANNLSLYFQSAGYIAVSKDNTGLTGIESYLFKLKF